MMAIETLENANRLLEKAQAYPKKGRLGRPSSDLKLAPTPYDVIHRDNKLRLLLYRRNPRVERSPLSVPILIIPSLINRHYILDLMPGKSVVGHLVEEGFDVAMIDWGAPGDEDRFLTFERYVDTYVHRAIHALGKATGTSQAVVLGYCLGGTMGAIHAALRPSNIAGLIALTAPVNFHNSGLLSAWCRSPGYDVDGLVRAFGNVPWPLMQAAFQSLRPTLSASRAWLLRKRAHDRDFVESSWALEVWVNDNVSFAGECYRDFIQQLYRENAMIRGTLRVGERPVDLKSISCPILNVAASEDHIVPLDATRPLRELVASRDYSELIAPGGHIGAVISRKASTGLWPAMSDWLRERYAVERPAPAQDQALASTPHKPSTAKRKRVRPWQEPLLTPNRPVN